MLLLADATSTVGQPGLLILLQIACQVLILLCFVRVAAYVTRKVKAGRLINGRAAPVRFKIRGIIGWAYVASVLTLLYTGSAYYMILVVMGLGIFLLLNEHTAEEQFGLARLPVPALVKWSLLTCGAVIFVEVPLTDGVNIVMNAVHLPHPQQQSVEVFRKMEDPSSIVAFMVQAVLISPLIEELFFRGFVLTFMKNFTTTWLALVLSAGFFAFAHLNFGSVVQLWVLGIVLGVAYEHTGCLLLPIGIHACWNLMTAVSLLLTKGVN